MSKLISFTTALYAGTEHTHYVVSNNVRQCEVIGLVNVVDNEYVFVTHNACVIRQEELREILAFVEERNLFLALETADFSDDDL